MKSEELTIKYNRSKRTYTIRKYVNGKLFAKYRSLPQSQNAWSEDLTEGDIRAFLKGSDYYLVKRKGGV